MKSVVVTGASTGIGWATAKLLLDRGFRVFGSVRKQADADRLKGEFGANFTPLLFDVTDEAAVLAAARDVRTALNGEKLAGLVNNAGIAVAGPVLGLSADEFRRQMDVNVIGPIIATQAFGPLLGADTSLKGPPGRIVMISSVAGQNGNPLTSAYSASKHAIEGLSEGLRRELMLFGIDVIIVAPGAVKTPIWSKAEEADISPYKNSPFLPAMEKMRAFMLALGPTGYRRKRSRNGFCGADPAAPEGALLHRARPGSGRHDEGAAQASAGQDHRKTSWPDAAGMTTGKNRAELTGLANEALRSEPGCETARVVDLQPRRCRRGRNWEIPNVAMGDSLISDVDRAVITVHRRLGRQFHLLGDYSPARARRGLLRHADHP